MMYEVLFNVHASLPHMLCNFIVIPQSLIMMVKTKAGYMVISNCIECAYRIGCFLRKERFSEVCAISDSTVPP